MKALSRRERLVFLLDHLSDCFDPAGGHAIQGGDGSIGVAMLPRMSRHPSVLELLRCLDVLERMAPAHSRAVQAYFGSGWKVVRVPKTVKHGERRRRLVNQDGTMDYQLRRERALPSWLRAVPTDRETGEPRTVARGIDFVSGVFQGDVFLPDELLEAA